LPLAHAGNGDAGKHALLRKRVAVGKFLGFGAARDIDDKHAADRLRALVVLRGTGQHQNALLAAQIITVRLQHGFANRSSVWFVDAGYGPEHENSPHLMWTLKTLSLTRKAREGLSYCILRITLHGGIPM